MKGSFVVAVAIAAGIAASACRRAPASEPFSVGETPSAGYGTIRGRVRLTGTPPENAVLRMRADPMCEAASGNRRSVQQTVVAADDGSLANVFVQLQGSFPDAPVPTTPVTIDQRGCIYTPRVIGLRVGQTLRVLNSDPGLHNVHGVADNGDGFNIGQPMAGMSNDLHPKSVGILRLQCDVHTWMVAFVGVVSHQYFAVTDAAGTFEIQNVPVGIHTIQSWHEVYGLRSSNVRVESGGVTDIALTYASDQRPTAF